MSFVLFFKFHFELWLTKGYGWQNYTLHILHFHFHLKLWLTIGPMFSAHFQLSLWVMADKRFNVSLSVEWGRSSRHFDAWLPICPSIGRPVDIQSTARRSIENEMPEIKFKQTTSGTSLVIVWITLLISLIWLTDNHSSF